MPRQNRSRKCRWEKADIKWMLIGWIEKMHVWIWKLQSFTFGFFSGGMMSIDTCPFEVSNEWETVSVSEHYLFGKVSILRLSSIPSYINHPSPSSLSSTSDIYIFFSTDQVFLNRARRLWEKLSDLLNKCLTRNFL